MDTTETPEWALEEARKIVLRYPEIASAHLHLDDLLRDAIAAALVSAQERGRAEENIRRLADNEYLVDSIEQARAEGFEEGLEMAARKAPPHV